MELSIDTSNKISPVEIQKIIKHFKKDQSIKYNNIFLRIDFESGLEEYGTCVQDDIDYFSIQLSNRLNKNSITKTLFHELWHVKQYLDGDLSRKIVHKRCLQQWKSKDQSNIPYEDREFEKEAEKNALRLFKTFKH